MLEMLIAIGSKPTTFSQRAEPWRQQNPTLAMPLNELESILPRPRTSNRKRSPHTKRPAPRKVAQRVESEIPTQPAPKAKKIAPAAPNIDVAHYQEALVLNGWNPANPTKLKSGYYADPKEIYYRSVRCIICGSIDGAGEDGWRFVEIITLMASGYLGRISFRDQGELANLADDLVQEAVAKCCLALKSFSIYDKRVKSLSCNNAFAYFTTVIRNKMYETLRSPLKSGSLYLEDLCTDNQSVCDVF